MIISEKLSTTGQIASSIAHEIKNPLTNIITASKLLSTAKTPDMIDKYFEICERNSWLAIDKVNALLEYAKQTKMNYTESSLRTILKDAINLAKGSLEKYEVEANLIYKTYDDVIRVDRKEFTGALVNLILNSVQAMEEKKENKHIDLILSKEDNEFIIEISDNGSGIPAETIPKVFTPFFTSKESGTGLGLSYAQKVVIEHSGHISIKSELDRGTQVLIKLPVNS
ncbi:HAMP domain-containing histidine kinase [bacterium]|nr:HAMP domain-containing histidine kinase [bacterium]